MKPLTLYDLDRDLLDLEGSLLEAGGEITEELEARYHDLLDLREDKVEGYVRVIRRLEATAEAVKAERQRLQEAERGLARAAQSLKDRLARSMRERGDGEYLTALGRVKLQQAGTPPVELLVEADALPEHFVRIKRSADLTALREALSGDDGERREEAARLARLGEAAFYVRLY